MERKKSNKTNKTIHIKFAQFYDFNNLISCLCVLIILYSTPLSEKEMFLRCLLVLSTWRRMSLLMYGLE